MESRRNYTPTNPHATDGKGTQKKTAIPDWLNSVVPAIAIASVSFPGLQVCRDHAFRGARGGPASTSVGVLSNTRFYLDLSVS